jgi:type VI secretion system secreted protein VgrG
MSDHEHVILDLASGDTTSVRRFAVHEALSMPYEVNLIVHSENWEVPLEPNVGQKASFKLKNVTTGPQERTWGGVCSHLAQLRAETDAASTYLVRLVPKIWLLSQRRGHRIFQRKKLVDIVKEVLDEWKVDNRIECTNEYIKHDYVVQYGETDLAFISRLLERAGITYYFDFEGGGDVVLSDAPHLGKERPGDALPWCDKPQESATAEWVCRTVVGYAVRPGDYKLRDFDFRRQPDFDLIGKAEPEKAPEDHYERYHYEPGDMKRVDPPDGSGGGTPIADDKGKVRHSMKEGETMAKFRLRAERFGRRVVKFETNCNDLHPGTIIKIDDHPRDDLTVGDKLLVSSFRLEGVVGQKWTYCGESVLADKPYHPPAVTPRPRIDGLQSAIVVGPAGEEIYCDEFGRVRAQFHWDRDGKYDDNSSCWMRVSQDWAGAGYGSQLIPRISQEVLIAFLDGDPDQPMIVGRVYNEKQKVPYKLPDHKTRSGWKSNSSPGSEGYNEILMEDKAGKEIVYHQAERDLLKLTKREEVERINENDITLVGNDRSVVVKSVDATMVGGVNVKQMMAPSDKDDLKIFEQKVPSLSPTDTTMEMIANRFILTTGQATIAFDGDKLQFEAAGNITLNAKGADVILESNRCFINTMGPPAAAKPDPVQDVPPGTFTTKQGDAGEAPPPPQEAPKGAPVEAMPSAMKKHKVKGKMMKGQLFVDGPSPTDVKQGAIGDCYLMAAMASVANTNPEILEKNIKENPDGTVTVTLCDGGKPVDVVVDKEVPVGRFIGGQKYGKSTQKNELWVSMVEKAYAEQFGKGDGYEGIGHGGYTEDAMSHITCGKSDREYNSSYDMDDPASRQEFLDVVSKANTQPVAASSPHDDAKWYELGLGLPSGHAYSVTGVTKNKKGQDIVHIQNPHNMSKLETMGLMKYGSKFSMPLEKFHKAFSSVQVNNPV